MIHYRYKWNFSNQKLDIDADKYPGTLNTQLELFNGKYMSSFAIIARLIQLVVPMRFAMLWYYASSCFWINILEGIIIITFQLFWDWSCPLNNVELKINAIDLVCPFFIPSSNLYDFYSTTWFDTLNHYVEHPIKIGISLGKMMWFIRFYAGMWIFWYSWLNKYWTVFTHGKNLIIFTIWVNWRTPSNNCFLPGGWRSINILHITVAS